MSADDNVVRKLALLKLAEELGSVTEACKNLGVSRDTFYRAKQAFETGGSEGLRNISRRKPNFKNRVSLEIEQAVLRFSLNRPSYGQVRISKEMARMGIRVSPAGVRCIWQRHNCETTQKRHLLRISKADQGTTKATELTNKPTCIAQIVLPPSGNVEPKDIAPSFVQGPKELPNVK